MGDYLLLLLDRGQQARKVANLANPQMSDGTTSRPAFNLISHQGAVDCGDKEFWKYERWVMPESHHPLTKAELV
jgi:hypothetical protein